MQTFFIPYGKGRLSFPIQKSQLVGVLEPAGLKPLGSEKSQPDQQGLVKAALENPIGTPRLCDLARGKARILVITSDHTRPVPSVLTVPLLLKEIRSGNPAAEIVILIATGVHRPTTEAELRAKLGDAIVDHEQIEVHRAEIETDMVCLGTLSSGGALWLNQRVQWADLVISEGFIEPHFFAGFSGGRKSILPGIAARRTVLYNHNASFITNTHARQGVLENNPIHQDMAFAAKAAGLAFILNVLLDSEKRVIAAFAGDAQAAHEAGCQLSHRLARVPAVEADIVVVSNGGYPLDQNVYQAVKGMTAAERCVRPGGVIIMCAALADGHGGEAFYQWMAQHESPEATRQAIQDIPPEATEMDQWEAQILARVLCKAACIFVTEAKNRPLIESMHMRWAGSPEEALALAETLTGAEPHIAVIPDGVGVIVE